MLTQEEERFIRYWESNRNKRKKSVVQIAIGLPLALLFVGAILINLVSGWYKRADATIKMDTSSIIVILIACIGIVAFILYFSSKYNWEQSEQRYNELLAKKEKR